MHAGWCAPSRCTSGRSAIRDGYAPDAVEERVRAGGLGQSLDVRTRFSDQAQLRRLVAEAQEPRVQAAFHVLDVEGAKPRPELPAARRPMTMRQPARRTPAGLPRRATTAAASSFAARSNTAACRLRKPQRPASPGVRRERPRRASMLRVSLERYASPGGTGRAGTRAPGRWRSRLRAAAAEIPSRNIDRRRRRRGAGRMWRALVQLASRCRQRTESIARSARGGLPVPPAPSTPRRFIRRRERATQSGGLAPPQPEQPGIGHRVEQQVGLVAHSSPAPARWKMNACGATAPAPARRTARGPSASSAAVVTPPISMLVSATMLDDGLERQMWRRPATGASPAAMGGEQVRDLGEDGEWDGKRNPSRFVLRRRRPARKGSSSVTAHGPVPQDQLEPS